MKKIKKHSTSFIILTIATISILDFSFRKAPVPTQYKKLNIAKVDFKSPELNKKQSDSERVEILPQHTHDILFPLDGFLYHGGFFPIDRKDYMAIKDLESKPENTIYGSEAPQFNHFLSLVKIVEEKSFQEIMLAQQKK